VEKGGGVSRECVDDKSTTSAIDPARDALRINFRTLSLTCHYRAYFPLLPARYSTTITATTAVGRCVVTSLFFSSDGWGCFTCFIFVFEFFDSGSCSFFFKFIYI
jgi:hypothetical protein